MESSSLIIEFWYIWFNPNPIYICINVQDRSSGTGIWYRLTWTWRLLRILHALICLMIFLCPGRDWTTSFLSPSTASRGILQYMQAPYSNRTVGERAVNEETIIFPVGGSRETFLRICRECYMLKGTSSLTKVNYYIMGFAFLTNTMHHDV